MSVLCPPPSAVILAFEVFRTLTESLQTLPVFLFFFNSLVPYRQSNFFLAVFTSGVEGILDLLLYVPKGVEIK